MVRTSLILTGGLMILCGSARAEPLAAELNLTIAQQPIFVAWDATRRGDPARLKALSAQQLAARTAPAFLDNMQAWAEYRLDWSRKAVATAHDLYGVLTPAQRAVFDAAFLPKSEKDAPPVAPVPPEPAGHLADPAAPEHTTPDWSRKPSGDELAAFYPLRAFAESRSGRATIKCVVTTLGVVASCVVVEEDPAGYGFGNATIEVASGFRFHPATVYGVSTTASVTIPLNWSVQDDVSEAAQDGTKAKP